MPSSSPDRIARITGWSGCAVCSIAVSGSVRPPRAAGDLPHELKGSFGRAQVGALKPEVRIDHAHERELWEVVPLGHDLGADDRGRSPPLAMASMLRLQRPGRCRRGRTTSTATRASGNRVCDLLGQPFDTGAEAASRPVGAAVGAGPGIGRVSPHWWHISRFRKRCSTIRASQCVAADLVAAGPADGDRRVAAAVEEQQRLLALARAARRTAARRLGETQRGWSGRSSAHVDGAHLRAIVASPIRLVSSTRA